MASGAIVTIVGVMLMVQTSLAAAQDAATSPPVVREPSGDAAKAPGSPISRALALLGDAAPGERIVVEHTVRRAFVMSVATAWTDGVAIFINDQSEPYQRARKDAIALAGAIVHESYHLRHGLDEPSAYAEQLRVMRRLGARRHDLDLVERGLRAVQLANQSPGRESAP
jgi:hypothetical protein